MLRYSPMEMVSLYTRLKMVIDRSYRVHYLRYAVPRRVQYGRDFWSGWFFQDRVRLWWEKESWLEAMNISLYRQPSRWNESHVWRFSDEFDSKDSRNLRSSMLCPLHEPTYGRWKEGQCHFWTWSLSHPWCRLILSLTLMSCCWDRMRALEVIKIQFVPISLNWFNRSSSGHADGHLLFHTSEKRWKYFFRRINEEKSIFFSFRSKKRRSYLPSSDWWVGGPMEVYQQDAFEHNGTAECVSIICGLVQAQWNDLLHV